MLQENRIKGGEILFASHTLEGTYFENALILLIDNNRDGVFGVILNRPSHMPLSETFNYSFDLPITSRMLYIGGPVDEEMLLTLSLIDDPSESKGGMFVSDGVELGGTWENMEEIIMSDEKSVHIFLGYTGWSEKQLQEELAEGSWKLYKGFDTRKVLQDWCEPLALKRRDIEAYLEKGSK